MSEANTKQIGGNHYRAMSVQPWDVVDTWPIEQRIGYYRGGALKYLMRMGSKDESAQEIGKGKHYMEKLLEVLAERDEMEARKHVNAAAERQKLDVKKNQGGSMKFDFEDFAAKAKELEHVTDFTVREVDGRVEFVTEAYLAKDDGTVERGYAHGHIGTMELQERGEPLVPGQWLLDPFERGIKDRYRGFTRYATADEIAAHKAGEAA